MKIYLASDHAGVELKSKIVLFLANNSKFARFEVHDLGPHSLDSVDYPDFADSVCQKIHGFTVIDTQHETLNHPAEFGILICGTGQGMCMRANKFAHIRAALCCTPEVAKLSREHNDANVLCLGGRLLEADLALKIVQTFLETPFTGGRHQKRVAKLSQPV